MSTPMETKASQTTFLDPVCGMEVTAVTAAGKTEDTGTTYYFCSAHCQRTFTANPSAFVKTTLPSGTSAGCCGAKPAEIAHSCCGGGHDAAAKVLPSAK